MNIIAIGGGKIADKETLHIDRYIIAQSVRTNPRVLFIPTATRDDLAYRANFGKIYQGLLHCQVRELLLHTGKPDPDSWAELIQWADIIYVGGGNTLMMMRKWRRYGIDQLLISRTQDQVVLCGTSAGAICWFESGHSDSMSFYHPANWDYIRVKGLGILPRMGCPHYMAEGRKQSFIDMVFKSRKTGIAVDNRNAIHFKDGFYKAIAPSGEPSGCFLLIPQGGNVIEKVLVPLPDFQPVSF